MKDVTNYGIKLDNLLTEAVNIKNEFRIQKETLR
jgi:hypothetical protein